MVYIVLHWVTLGYNGLHWVTSGYIGLQVILYFIVLHLVTWVQWLKSYWFGLHCVTLCNIVLHYVTLCYIALHCVTLSYIGLHCVSSVYIVLHFIYKMLHWAPHPNAILCEIEFHWVTIG
jgi:hypothetical protein